MSTQIGLLFQSDVGRPVRFPIAKSAATTIDSARLMVTPAGSTTSIEWEVTIATQTDTQITLQHTLVAGSLPSTGTYLWRAYFYDAGGDEFDSSRENVLTVRAMRVQRPTP